MFLVGAPISFGAKGLFWLLEHTFAIPEELINFLTLTESCEPLVVADAILRITTEPVARTEAMEKAEAGRRYMIEHATVEAQGRSLAMFIDQICAIRR